MNVDTADTSLAATQHALFQQKVEGLNSSQLMWGTSNAQNISVSFWIKSSLTGTFTYYALDESADSQSYVQTFTIDSANTWEKKTFIIEGPTTGGTTDFPITTATSFFTGISLGVGSTHQTSTTGSWHSTANFAASTSSAVKLIGTASANMYVTGWQIELGNQVTPFEHRSFGEEELLCQRYYYQSADTVTSGGVSQGSMWCGENINTSECFGSGMNFPVTMRATPTVTIFDNSGNSGQAHMLGTADVSGVAVQNINRQGFSKLFKSGGLTDERQLGAQYTADAEL